MRIKKEFIFIIFVLLIHKSIFSQSSFLSLMNLVLENNIDIKNNKLMYETARISAKTHNGIYSPQISINTSTLLDKDYENALFPNGVSVDISLSQFIPGGFQLSSIGTFETITNINQNNLRNIQKNTQIKLMISNSLYPYWIQGHAKDPSLVILEKQKQYNYNQLVYTKKIIMENLLQKYATALILKENIQSYENSIMLIQKQIEAYNEDIKLGYSSLSKITELKNTKLSYQQELISAQYNYEDCISNLENLCGFSFDKEILQNNIENMETVIQYIKEHTDNIKDPYEENLLIQIEILELKRIKLKENISPKVDLSFMLTLKKDEKNIMDSYSFGLGIDFSSMLNSFISNPKIQSEIEINSAKNEYHAYLKQRHFLKNQYDKLFNLYNVQLQTIKVLLDDNQKELNDMKKQVTVGDISILDYDIIDTNLKNLQLSKNCIEINCWLYEILSTLYTFD